MVNAGFPPALRYPEDVASVVFAVIFALPYLGDAAQCRDYTLGLGKRSVTLPVDRRSVAARRGAATALAPVRPPESLAYGVRASTVAPPCLGDTAQCGDSIIGAGKLSERAGFFYPDDGCCVLVSPPPPRVSGFHVGS